MSTETWGEAHARIEAAIRAHPAYPRLVREVAVAEQPSGRPWRLRNSMTYAAWWDRGMRRHRNGRLDRRAYALCETILADLDFLLDSPKGERVAAIYVCARQDVRARRRGRLP